MSDINNGRENILNTSVLYFRTLVLGRINNV